VVPKQKSGAGKTIFKTAKDLVLEAEALERAEDIVGEDDDDDKETP
jgi:hypothetical protein